MVRYMQVLQPPRNRRAGICSLEGAVVSRAAWRHGKLPHLSPRKLSTSAAWQTERPRAPLIIPRPTPKHQSRRRGSAWTATTTRLHTNRPTAKVTPTHTYPCAQPHLGYHSISATAAFSLLETLTKTASCSLSSVSATLRPIHLCHQSPQRLPILLDSPLSPTPWVVAPRAAGACGTR